MHEKSSTLQKIATTLSTAQQNASGNEKQTCLGGMAGSGPLGARSKGIVHKIEGLNEKLKVRRYNKKRPTELGVNNSVGFYFSLETKLLEKCFSLLPTHPHPPTPPRTDSGALSPEESSGKFVTTAVIPPAGDSLCHLGPLRPPPLPGAPVRDLPGAPVRDVPLPGQGGSSAPSCRLQKKNPSGTDEER